jgi:TolA-binding protein
MKSTERHKLKQNEFAQGVANAREMLETRGRDIGTLVVVVGVALALVAGYTWWRSSRDGRANTMLAEALAIYEAPVVTATAPAPGSPMPVQQPGTYATEQAKLEAALPKFVEAANAYPSTNAGIVARYHAAATLAVLGKYTEAEQRYQEVVDKAGRNSIYGRTARLGLADSQAAQGKYDNAINTYRELSTDTSAQLPVDGILMQLGRVYVKAGKKDDAVRAFNRVVEEFPQSVYVADARKELADAKKS